MSEFEATLPDGSSMEIEILGNTGAVWSGEFAVATETGPYAHQVGSFEGSVSGNSITATCETLQGAEFQLTGTANADKSLSLTRSDLPGTVLTFVPVVQQAAASNRADVSFNFNTGSSSGRVTLSDSPFSVHSSMTEYRGSWLGVPVTFWSYTSGYASIVTYVDPMCINMANFSNYKIADLGSATLTSASSQLTMYSSVVKAQIKFRGSVNVSP